MANSNEKPDRAILSADDSMYEPQRNEQALRCPNCGAATGLHIDGAAVENASGQKLQVEATDEDSSARLSVHLDNDADHDGRRHQISLIGWCELCESKFNLAFRQHKGMTYFTKTVTKRNLPKIESW
ncbi:hypothetical protein [Arthrobacter psychrochitiniphilus]|uniref:hypothetical protein n=1 Tax=Arthrobacter psychrochitiniphilus TaxID=291045 RepID=UPI003F7C447E